MKKKVISLISALVMCMTLTVPVWAVNSDFTNSQDGKYLKNSLLNDLNFLANADVSKKFVDGTYVYQFTTKDETTTMNRSNEQNFTCSAAQIIAPSEEEAVKVEQNIQRARQQSLLRSGGGSPSKYDWFLGDSLYLELKIDYTSKVVAQQTYYRMEKITATRSVNSGTIISSATLNYGVHGTSESGSPVNHEEHPDITSRLNPYSTTAPSYWEYACQGDEMSAGLEVYARRPGGRNILCTLSLPIFI